CVPTWKKMMDGQMVYCLGIMSTVQSKKRQCSTRSVIERTFGRLKRRFHILHSEIRMKPGKACKIIIACAILHNICILLNEPDIEDDGVIVGNDGDLGEHFNGHQDGRAVRDHISTTFFNH
ncbi:Hypothetical predicted protein, partial [Mytilus galloprovincialis]